MYVFFFVFGTPETLPFENSPYPPGRFPLGVAALAICFTGPLARYVSPKWLITLGNVLMIVAMILFSFADSPDGYWPFVFTGLGIGSAGAMLAYTHSRYAACVPFFCSFSFFLLIFDVFLFSNPVVCSIAIFASVPPSMAGIVGAIFNCGCQLGAAVGLAVDVSIETSVEEKTRGGFTHFEGRRAVFYWQIAAVALEGLAVLVFYRTDAGLDERRWSSGGETLEVRGEEETKGKDACRTRE